MSKKSNFASIGLAVLFIVSGFLFSLPVSAQAICIDNDNDGFFTGTGCLTRPLDCDDGDAKVYPGAPKICDGKDSNCDGRKDFLTDVDSDGDGVPLCANDCNDNNPNIYPGKFEAPLGSPICSDGLDNDCDGKIDAVDSGCKSFCIDYDEDGYGANGHAACPNGIEIDCNDFYANMNPGNIDIDCNGIDENCSGVADEGYVPTASSCGVGACSAAGQLTCQSGAVVDTCTPGSPQTEGPLGDPTCSDSVDNDCDGSMDVADPGCLTACIDIDGDGYGSNGHATCPNGAAIDCNDTNPNINPGKTDDDCNGVDEDCSGTADNGYVMTITNCGVGACAGTGLNQCQSGVVVNTCTAGSPGIEGPYGNATCSDAIDNNCNGLTDAADLNCNSLDIDDDNDGYTENNGDCDDTDPKVYPGAPKICDGKDNNCDGRLDLSTDIDNDHDGVPICGGDCNDNDPAMYPGNIEGPFGDPSCSDGKDNDCDKAVDAVDNLCKAPVCETATNPKQGPHFIALLNPDGSTHIENSELNCGKCHAANFADPIRYACQRCHADPADTSDSLNGVTKAIYPLNAPYGFGSALNVAMHSSATVGTKYGSWTMGGKGCVVCHNPHVQEQNNSYGTDYGQYIKNFICYDNDVTGVRVEKIIKFTAPNGPGSFADGPPNDQNVCEMCHTRTNHHQNDGTATGGQAHNDSTNCTQCHPHIQGFKPTGGVPAAPHDTAPFLSNCDYCHVSASDFSSPIPDSKCEQCHTSNGALKTQYPQDFGAAPNVMGHSGKPCVECHDPMFGSTNLKLVSSQIASSIIPGSVINFTAQSGPGSFADGPPYNDNICETCHSATNHHQSDGAAPGGQDHNNGSNCAVCHPHSGGFLPTGVNVPEPHNAFDCTACHVTPDTYVPNAAIPNSACLICHGLNTPGSSGGGSDWKVDRHYSSKYIDPATNAPLDLECVECHNPMSMQRNFRGNDNIKFIRNNIRGNNIVFESYDGAYSFAEAAGMSADMSPENYICNTCHTQTNHHQNDGTAPGGQLHHDGLDCTVCHDHIDGFQPNVTVPAPHNAFDCTVCHVTPDTYVPNASIPNSACLNCHNGTTAPDAAAHYSDTYIDPLTGSLVTINCVECHNPMRTQTNFRGNDNLKFIRTTIRGNAIVFESETGPYSFANDSGKPADMGAENYICNTCHTQTNHHRNDGLAPAQSHNDGTTCTVCHTHPGGFTDHLTSTPVPAPHSAFNCTVCHVTPDTYVPNADIPNEVCLVCHDGSVATMVVSHFSQKYNDPATGQLMELDCVECHNPMFIQTNFRGNDNLKFVRKNIRGNDIAFETYTGQYSFADDSGMPADMTAENYVCNTCHTQTNHHRANGTAPAQSHHDSEDCRACHSHSGGFTDQLTNAAVPAPHNNAACEACHVTPDTYVQNADIPKSACLACHDISSPGRSGGGSDLKVDSHYSNKYTDPTTSQLMDLECVECHNPMSIQTNFRGNVNLKFVRTTIRGNNVAFESKTGPYSFADDSNKPADMATQNYVCNTCHTQTNHHQNDGTAPGGQSHNDGLDCTVCHDHLGGFQPSGGCTICHSEPQGNRVAVVDQFGGSSHHIQGVEVTDEHCYQCHWEANSDGSINSIYHGGWDAPGSEVNLVIYGSGIRPAAYSLSTAVEYTAGGSAGGGIPGGSTSSRTEELKINKVCLGCHSAKNNTTQPFGDGKTPKQYAWDGSSIDERYSQTGTTPWGKYSDTSATDITPKNTQTKAYSAHGNAAANQRGWNLSETWPNTSGSESVLCFDCHNSHGSTVSGKTTSYTSATSNGAMLKDTTAGKGGYSVTYKPSAGGSAANHNSYNAGAGLCFDCHMTANKGSTPWGYGETFGASQAIMGYSDTTYFGPGFSGQQDRFPYRYALAQMGGHLGASEPLSTQAMGTIGGLCTPCHDPHGVSSTLGSNKQYGVPLLKGTWMTSPYKEDVAPSETNECRGGSREEGPNAFCDASTPGYHIDQNTFTKWNFTSTASVTESDTQFAGLCMQCHTKTNLNPNSTSTWKSVDRIHNAVKGWDNDASTMHRYTCSKCHTPHNSALGRLLVTNCLDSAHRGRVEAGGRAPSHSGRGEEGSGNGAFPAGGGGRGEEALYPGPWFFGSTSGGRACHDNENNNSFPDNQIWNVVTPWGDLGVGGTQCSDYQSRSSCENNNNCRWSDNMCSNR